MRAVILFSVFGFALPVLVLVLSLSVWWDIDGLRAPFARVLEILVFRLCTDRNRVRHSSGHAFTFQERAR